MIIEIRLTQSKYLFHNEIVELPEDKVELLFVGTAHSIGALTLSLKRDENVKQYKIQLGTPIDITEFFSVPGEVKASVALTSRGKVLRTWQIEPLIAKGIPDGIEVVPAVVELQGRVKTLEAAVIELSKIINDK